MLINLYKISPSKRSFLLAADLLHHSRTNLYKACLSLIGELTADYYTTEDELLKDMVTVIQSVGGVLETPDSLDKLLPDIDEVQEIACAMVCYGSTYSNPIIAAACIALYENNHNLTRSYTPFDVEGCISQLPNVSYDLFSRASEALMNWGYREGKTSMTNLSCQTYKVKTTHPIELPTVSDTGKYEEFEYSTVNKLGEGAFGSVYKHDNFAIKRVEIYETSGLTPTNTVWNEINALSQLNSTFVIQLKKFYVSSDATCHMMLELAEGDLTTAVYRKQAVYNDMIRGLSYIHKKGFVHMDINPRNILIVNGIAKLADFGSSRLLNGPVIVSMGTLNYRAPELLKFGNVFFKQVQACKEHDIWSLGCTIAEVELGEMLFDGDDEREVLISIASKLGSPYIDFYDVIWKGLGIPETDENISNVFVSRVGGDEKMIQITDRKLKLWLSQMLTFGVRSLPA